MDTSWGLGQAKQPCAPQLWVGVCVREAAGWLVKGLGCEPSLDSLALGSDHHPPRPNSTATRVCLLIHKKRLEFLGTRLGGERAGQHLHSPKR